MYRIKVNNKWLKVDYYIFRSWSGERRIGNSPVAGPLFYLGSNDRSR